MAEVTQEQVIDYIKGISVLELSQLVKELEEEQENLVVTNKRHVKKVAKLLEQIEAAMLTDMHKEQGRALREELYRALISVASVGEHDNLYVRRKFRGLGRHDN